MRVTTRDGRCYLDDWILVLEKLLGWDRRRALTWATHYEIHLNDETSTIWRENSVFYVAFLLIPDSVKERLNLQDREYLVRRLEAAVLHYPECVGLPLANYDWNAVIARIDQVLAEYEESLTNVRRQYE